MKLKSFLWTLAAISMFSLAYAGLEAIRRSYELPITIVIPSYNNKAWYRSNLDSVARQNYSNYRVVYTDDASPDGTGELVRQYIADNGLEHRIQLIQNKERRGSLSNLYSMISNCDSQEIIVDLDGDDWLAHRDVLAELNEAYSDPNTWMTYGQFVSYPHNQKGFAEQIPAKVIQNNDFRAFRGAVTHLRTFYAGLFQKIKKDDLMYNGNFFSVAGDMAFLIPICEMAGKHSKFIPQVLYVYNASNPISDDKLQRSLQVKLDNVVRSRPKYEPLMAL